MTEYTFKIQFMKTNLKHLKSIFVKQNSIHFFAEKKSKILQYTLNIYTFKYI